MNPIKRLFAVKDDSPAQKKNKAVIPDVTDEALTYFESGYGSAKMANGSPVIFNRCLDDVYQKFKEKCRSDEKEQQRLNTPYIEEQERQRTELKKAECLKSIKEDDLNEINTSLNKIDNDISNVRNEPKKYGIDATKKPKAQFFIGILILIPITLYLLVFYISASYSAFFKSFESSDVIAAIFDANALAKSFNDGWLEAVFVTTIPFAFMGLGYSCPYVPKRRVNLAVLKLSPFLQSPSFLIRFLLIRLREKYMKLKGHLLQKTLT